MSYIMEWVAVLIAPAVVIFLIVPELAVIALIVVLILLAVLVVAIAAALVATPYLLSRYLLGRWRARSDRPTPQPNREESTVTTSATIVGMP